MEVAKSATREPCGTWRSRPMRRASRGWWLRATWERPPATAPRPRAGCEGTDARISVDHSGDHGGGRNGIRGGRGLVLGLHGERQRRLGVIVHSREVLE